MTAGFPARGAGPLAGSQRTSDDKSWRSADFLEPKHRHLLCYSRDPAPHLIVSGPRAEKYRRFRAHWRRFQRRCRICIARTVFLRNARIEHWSGTVTARATTPYRSFDAHATIDADFI